MTKDQQSLKNACDYLLDSVEGLRNENGKLLTQISKLENDIASRNIQINKLTLEADKVQVILNTFFNKEGV